MYGFDLTSPLANATYLHGRQTPGVVVGLIGVDVNEKVRIDPDGVDAYFGHNIILEVSNYINWTLPGGSTGYGFRDLAGTIQFKNSGGAWAALAAAAASAGGWTDDGTVVRLDTGTDQVGIGTVTPVAGTKLHVASTDAATRVLFTGTTMGVRFGFSAIRSLIEGVDVTGVGSYQPLNLNGSALEFGVSAASRLELQPTYTVFNEVGADVDFRIETDTNPNHFVSDAGLNAGVGAFGFGAAAANDTFIDVNPPAITARVSASFFKVLIENAGAITVPTGTAPVVCSFGVVEPNITATGTVADAYSVYIQNAPTEGTRNGALWVAAGQVRFSGMPTSAAGLPSGTLWSNSGVVNIVP